MVAENRLYAYLHVAQSGTHHMRVRQFAYSDALKEALKRVGSPAHWLSDKWEWDYPLTVTAVTTLGSVAEEFGLEIEWDERLQEFANQHLSEHKYESQVRLAIEMMIKDQSVPVEQIVTNTVGGTLPPMRHQSIGASWGMRVSGLFLAWDPGLGKTRTGCDIAAANYRNGIIAGMTNEWITRQTEVVPAVVCPVTGVIKKPAHTKVVRHERWGTKGGVLVICPKSVIGSWRNELAKWQGMQSVPITGTATRKRRRAGTRSHVHICSYGSLHHVIDNDYDMLIVDEVHRCANNSVQMSRVRELSFQAKRRLVLSGSPVTNSPESVFYPMLICDHGKALGASKQAFLDRYFTKESEHDDPRYGKYVPREGCLAEISAKMAQCTYFLKKEDCLDLPPKTHTIRWVEMSTDQLKYYNQIKKEAVTYVQDSEVTVEQAGARMMKLKQICQGLVKTDDGKWKHFSNGKYDELMGLLTGELYGRKVVVWCDFREEIEFVARKLNELGIYWVRLDGTVNSDKVRQKNFDTWNNDPRCTVFLIQLQISEGYTIHANECQVPCYDAIYLGITWSFVHWIQSQDRIHRIGQHYPTTYRYILTTQGVDRAVYASLQHKAQYSEEVYTKGKEYYRQLLTDDVPGLSELTETAA